MNLEKQFEKRFGIFPLSNITYYLIAGQILLFVLSLANPSFRNSFVLQGELLFLGEWWRAITFLFVPLSMSPLWAVLQWYFMYMIGNALEREWGAFKVALYIMVGYFSSLLCALLFPNLIVTNSYIFTSLLLAFAYLNPDFTLLLFFIVPVKIKWLSYLTWLGLLASFVTGDLSSMTLILLSVSNFFLFFGKEVYYSLHDQIRQVRNSRAKRAANETTYMSCVVCRSTELDRKTFYYCHTCIPDQCYCEDHIKKHTHKIIN